MIFFFFPLPLEFSLRKRDPSSSNLPAPQGILFSFLASGMRRTAISQHSPTQNPFCCWYFTRAVFLFFVFLKKWGQGQKVGSIREFPGSRPRHSVLGRALGPHLLRLSRNRQAHPSAHNSTGSSAGETAGARPGPRPGPLSGAKTPVRSR